MNWRVDYTKRFLRELARLPKYVQERAENIVFHQFPSTNPFQLGYIESMKGYRDKYKIRIGNYRIGIAVDRENRVIICQRIAHRRDIYRIFP